MTGRRPAWRRIAIIAAAVALSMALGIALLASFAVPVGLGLFKNQIANTSMRLIGLPITFDRAVLRTGPQPQLSAKGLTLGPVDKPLLRVASLDVGIEMAALFSNQIKLTTIQISGLDYDPGAAQPKGADDDSEGGDWQLVAPPELSIVNATIQGENAHIDTLQLVTDQHSQLAMQASWRGLPMTMDLQLPALEALDAVRWDEARLALRVLGSELRADVSELSDSGGFLQVQGDIGSALWQQLGLTDGPRTLSIESRVRRDHELILLDGLAVVADSDHLQVDELSVNMGSERLSVAAQVDSVSVQLDRW